jgi:hypothetical protein
MTGDLEGHAAEVESQAVNRIYCCALSRRLDV